MGQRKSSSFGEQLKLRRLAAGFNSLDAAVNALRSGDRTRSPQRVRGVSKAMLNLLERDEVSSVRPEILRTLAALYKTSYADLSTAWFCKRFDLSVDDVIATHTFVQSVDEDSATLLGGSEEAGSVEIISLKRLEQLEGKLPAGSHVCVAAVRFLDDGPYYSMVTKNLLRGISHTYLLPEEGYPIYRAFLSKVESDFPKLRGKLDGKLTRYFPRINVEAPVNYVLFQLPDGMVQGYAGLLRGDIVQYFHVADARLSWRLLEGFEWSIRVASDAQLRRRLSELSAEFVHGRVRREKK